MSELIQNIFFTSILIFMLSIGYVQFRKEYYVVEDMEQLSIVIILCLSLFTGIVTAFILIWI